jgi:hypothetical protein
MTLNETSQFLETQVQAAIIENHDSANVHYIGQGKATQRKYKRLELGSGQACNCSDV